MCAADPKFKSPERLNPAWVPLPQDSLEQMAYDWHTQIEYDAAWGISTTRINGVTFYAVARKVGGVAS